MKVVHVFFAMLVVCVSLVVLVPCPQSEYMLLMFYLQCDLCSS